MEARYGNGKGTKLVLGGTGRIGSRVAARLSG